MKNNTQKTKEISARQAAIDYGIDMTLVDANLKKTPEQRIRDINNAWLGIQELRKGLKQGKLK